MKIVGYTDRLSVQQGQSIRFMVSSKLPNYQAEIVRLIHGDANPKGPGVKHKPVTTPVNGRYQGRLQQLHRGSFVVIADTLTLDYSRGFTLQAWICPTTPDKGVQGILTQWSDLDQSGYGIFIDRDCGAGLWIGDGQGQVKKLHSGKALISSQWYFVAATYEPRKGEIQLYQEPLIQWPMGASGAMVEDFVGHQGVVRGHTALLMAAYCKQKQGQQTQVAGHFNGKIDRPCFYGQALNPREIKLLKDGTSPRKIGEALIAAWDFSVNMSGSKVTDLGPRQLHGLAVNMPTRAVTGYNWTGNEVDFKAAPSEYGAIHFHDDDLENAEWEVDFELTVPRELPSGIYAARLSSSGAEDLVPFFVRPPKGKNSANIGFLLPSLTYIAYANQKFNNPGRMKTRGLQPGSSRPEDQFIVEERLHSLYDLHSDGSCVSYSSRLRPILNLRPGYYLPPLSMGAGSPHLLSADLHVVDWLEAKSYRYDVITDEDLHHEGVNLLSPYKVILTGTHPEYWTRQMIEAMQSYQARGGRLMYLGGNGFYWVTSVDPVRPHAVEVRRWAGSRSCEAEAGQYYHSTTGELGGLWRYRNRAAQRLVGVGFTSMGRGQGRPYRRKPDSFDPRATFIFEGLGSDELIGDFDSLVFEYGAAGFEIDRFDLSMGSPAHTLLLASSFGHSEDYQSAVEDLYDLSGPLLGSDNPRVRSDMVYFEAPQGGAIFSVGSITWCGCLSYNNYENNVSRVTDNVLRRFASNQALP